MVRQRQAVRQRQVLLHFTNHYWQLEADMALGDGIRRNIASVDPTERALLRDALIALNQRFFPGSRSDPIPGRVSWWFKQDEIHAATHVHRGPEFVPWHRDLVNRLEEMLRDINATVPALLGLDAGPAGHSER